MNNDENSRTHIYMYQFIFKSVQKLVVEPGNIKERLFHAGEEFLRAPEECIPVQLQDEYRDIEKYLTKYKGNKSDIHPFCSDVYITMKRRRNSTASKIAEKMWSFYLQYQTIIENKVQQ